jgi:DNA-binding response OmpR family regulator
LVVEDDPDTLEFYVALLEASGYRVLAAATGRAGLEHLSNPPIHGVVLDRRLPDIDGLLVCRRLRDRLGPNVPILIVTADHDPMLANAARAAGATAFLSKPFEIDELLGRLAALVPL